MSCGKHLQMQNWFPGFRKFWSRISLPKIPAQAIRKFCHRNRPKGLILSDRFKTKKSAAKNSVREKLVKPKIACTQVMSWLVCLLLAIAAGAQPKGKVEYYSTAQGLSHQRVTCITKDREGFMWFGSWDGINRFDGHSFTSYKSFPGDSSQLKNDRIDQIVEDEAGRLWMLAYDNQVYRFEKATERFYSLSQTLNPDGKRKVVVNKILSTAGGFVWLLSAEEGIFCLSQNNPEKNRIIHYQNGGPQDYRLPSNAVNFFHPDSDGRIWVGTAAGLCCLVKSNGVYKSLPLSLHAENITAFDEDSSALYFSTAGGNLLVWAKQSKRFRVQKIADSRINAVRKSKRSTAVYATTSAGELLVVGTQAQPVERVLLQAGEPLFSLFEDRTGCLWLEPQTAGVLRFNPMRRSLQRFSKSSREGLNAVSNRYGVLEDRNGAVWVNMKGGGFGYFNPEKQTVEFGIATPDAAGQTLPRNVNSLFYDPAGVLWLTTYERELVKIILQGNDFTQRLLADPESSASENEVRGVLYDGQNRLWLGAKSGRLHVYRQGRELAGLFENQPPQGIGLVYAMLEDEGGNVWLGTKGNGLYKAKPVDAGATKYRLIHYAPDKNIPGRLPARDVYALVKDRQGRIWIGTFDNGLVLMNTAGDSATFVHASKVLRQYPKTGFRRMRHLCLDGDGNLWAATTDGLLIVGADGRLLTAYRKVPGDKHSLGNNDVQFIYRDSKARMWLATSGGGFCRAVGERRVQALRFRNYTTGDGMPNDYALSCAEDKAGNLWIATENGLTKFNPETETFRNYDSYDGLPKASFSEAAVSKSPADGSFVFGTTRGFLCFDPARIGKKTVEANIVFTNLRINNQDAGPQSGFALAANVNYLSGLRLTYNQNIISIDYAILDHRAGNRQAFAYRLLGFDSTWHDDRQQRRATYTALPPGNYVFEVKSSSADLYSNTPYKRLLITILPPWWKTGWAYALYAVVIGVVLFFIRRYALAMIRLRNKIAVEQKLAALKMNFFTNVSHELRTPLTLIVNPLEQLAKREKLSDEGASLVDVARKNADRMVRFINQLLDLRKVQSNKAVLRISRVEMVSFVKKLTGHFTEAARSKRIKLEVISSEKELVAAVDAEKLDVVLYNLLGNAFKFSPEGRTIRVGIQSLPDEGAFSVAVHDQGPGVAPEKLEEIFELFQEGETASDRALKGTGIGLALCREFVALHRGRIWAANNKDGGLTVTVKLKAGTEHYKGGDVSFVETPKAAPLAEPPIERQLLLPHRTAPQAGADAPLVLLVEDNDELRIFLKRQLGEFYRVETAKDGQEGFEKAVSLVPDLIVSDIMMPVMDGIQMLDKVKADVNTSHVPVVLLSAKDSIESQLEGLRYGADGYITKPFNNEFLIASIGNLLRQRKKLFEWLVQKKPSVALSPEPVVMTSRDETFLKDVIRVVETKMADVDFNIEAVAESLAMSRTTFYKKFKSLTGMAPVEFVRDMRLQRARQLLDAGGSNVSEVAYLVGFGNPKYFSTCFKEKYRVSPSDYQSEKSGA